MRFGLIALLLLAGITFAQDTKDGQSFICVPDKSVGFAFNDSTKSWEHTEFRVGDDKYIVRPTTEDDEFAYKVWKFGEDRPFVGCEEGISEGHWLNCGGGGLNQFVVKIQSNRFIHIYQGGYMIATLEFKFDGDGGLIATEKEDEGGDTPFMQIGKCSKL